MKPLDVILEKLMEECLEVGTEVNLLGKSASKAFRFGMNSTPREIDGCSRTGLMTNYDWMNRMLSKLQDEMIDILTMAYLTTFAWEGPEAAKGFIAQQLPQAFTRGIVSIKLYKFSRYASHLVRKGSLTPEDLLQLETTVAEAAELLTPITTG
jgi:hypothetical protein